MKYLISACLMGENCKYNGGNNRNEALIRFLHEGNHAYICACPEVLGGLPTPRPCAEIKAGRVINNVHQDVSDAFRKGACRALAIAQREQVDICILQSRSPSCGVDQRYNGDFDGTLVKGSGIFAQLLQEHGILAIDVDIWMKQWENKEIRDR